MFFNKNIFKCHLFKQFFDYTIVSSNKISILSTAFNYPSRKDNLILSKPLNVGLFGYEKLTEPNGFYLMKEEVYFQTEALIDEILSPSKCRHIVKIFDELSNVLCSVADMADFIRVMHPKSDYSVAANEVCLSINSLVEQLNTDKRIYDVLKNELSKYLSDEISYNNQKFLNKNEEKLTDRSSLKLDPIDLLVGNLFLFDFEQSGIHLSNSIRSKFVQLTEQISQLSYSFSQNCHLPSYVPVANVRSDLRNYFSLDGDLIIVNSLNSDINNRQIREFAYKIFFGRNLSQEKRLENLLITRKKLAQLVGVNSYAEKVLKGSMATSPVIVLDFLNNLSLSLKNCVSKDLKILNTINTHQEEIKSWDLTYYIKQYKTNLWKEYNKSETLLREYFSLGTCMQGLDKLFQSLYNVTLVLSDLKHGETWNDDVKKISVVDLNTKKTIGLIYCDFFERSKKPNQDCHFTIRGGRLMDNGEYQIPIVALTLNFTHQLNPSTPVLLSYSNLENLFHEFGHAMHSMLGSTRYQHVTGTRCSTDFAEVPSILMEYFVSDERILLLFARHWKTGQTLSEESIRLIIKSKKLFQAIEMQQQIIYAIIDQQFHSENFVEGSTMQIMKEIHNKHSSLLYIDNSAYHLRFSHFVGYGAKYYSYLWSRAVASLVWNELFALDPLSQVAGLKWKNQVLKYGGEKCPKLMMQEILNKNINTKLLVDTLHKEILDAY